MALNIGHHGWSGLMWLTVFAFVGAAIGTVLWVRMFTTPPEDSAADRRLRQEINRHKGNE